MGCVLVFLAWFGIEWIGKNRHKYLWTMYAIAVAVVAVETICNTTTSPNINKPYLLLKGRCCCVWMPFHLWFKFYRQKYILKPYFQWIFTLKSKFSNCIVFFVLLMLILTFTLDYKRYFGLRMHENNHGTYKFIWLWKSATWTKYHSNFTFIRTYFCFYAHSNNINGLKYMYSYTFIL